MTAQMRGVLMSTPNEGAVAAAALSEGMTTLRASAIGKAHAGLTTYEEVLRVTHVDSSTGVALQRLRRRPRQRHGRLPLVRRDDRPRPLRHV